MKQRLPRSGSRPRRNVRAGGLWALGAALVVAALTTLPASAGLEVPPLPPLPLPTLSPVTGPVSRTVDGAGQVVDGLTEKTTGGTQPVGGKRAPTPRTGTEVDSWSIDRLPGLQGTAARTSVSSTQLSAPGSYTSLVSGGLRSAAGRAAHLVGPLAAPLAMALFALGLLAVAARGPGRLAKVDEERQSYRDRRSYRL